MLIPFSFWRPASGGSVPVVTAVLLIVAGGFTASGRGFADLNSLSDLGGSDSIDIMDGTSAQIPAGFCAGGASRGETKSITQRMGELIEPQTDLDTSK